MTLSQETKEQLEQLKACIHCGFCLPVCPTYKATGSEAESPRGRLYLLKQMLEDSENSSLPEENRMSHKQVEPHLSQCLGCLACENACPSGVEYGALLNSSKKFTLKQKNPFIRGFKQFFLKYILPNKSLLNMLSFWLRLYQKTGTQKLLQKLKLFKAFPLFGHYDSLIPKIAKHKPFRSGMSFGNPRHPRVALFTGCVMDSFYNPVHWASITALVENDYYVTIPEQNCCGALAHHGGEDGIAKALARKNILSILKSAPDWIVVNSAGCGSSMKDYVELLADDGIFKKKSQQFAEITVDIMELLAKKPLKLGKFEKTQNVAYHAACHLHHAQGIIDEPEVVLQQISGINLIPLKDASFCCGSAGIYNLEHPELSNNILAEKIKHIKATQAQTVVTGNPGCLLQISKGLQDDNNGQTPMRVAHPIELIAESYTQ